MSQLAIDPSHASQPDTRRAPSPSHRKPFDPSKWFYAFAGLVMLVSAVVGFEQFYFHGKSYPGREITPPIRTLVIVHGISMSLWSILILVQPLLVSLKRHKVHMTLGKVGATLAGVILVLGVMIGVQSARVAPPEQLIMGFNPRQFMAVPLLSVIIFASLVAVGVWKRKKPAIHRAMMLTATLAVISAALNRIDALNNLYVGTIWDHLFGPFFIAMVVGAVLAIARCIVARTFDRWLVGSVAGLILVSAGIVALMRTSAWDSIAGMILG
ncbi:MAG: hypothetical protein U0638_07270 [Phycisphaerales bacterium]